MNTEDFGKKILSIRQNANLTQEELALRIGVTPQAVSKWERGQSLPDISLLAELCKALNVSADLLLGLECRSEPAGSDLSMYPQVYSGEVLENLRYRLEPLSLIFSMDLVPLFVDGDYMERVSKLRTELSRDGILMPILRLQDDMRLESKEFMVMTYDRVLFRDKVENVDDSVLERMFCAVDRAVRENYGLILNRDLVKVMTDNLKLRYPALIEGVVPEKISYGLLQEVLKIFLSRGNYPMYLPKVIESLEIALYRNPDASIETLAEQVCADLETPDNVGVILANR